MCLLNAWTIDNLYSERERNSVTRIVNFRPHTNHGGKKKWLLCIPLTLKFETTALALQSVRVSYMTVTVNNNQAVNS